MTRKLVSAVSAFALIVAFSLATSSNAKAQPVAVYDPATGGVTFENVVEMVGLRINAPGLLVAGQATNLGGAAAGAFGVVNDKAAEANSFIEWGNLLGMTFESQFAGNIFQAGLSADAVGTGVEFLARASSAPTVNIEGSVEFIPEPSALLLSTMGLVGLLLRRRRV